MKKATILSLGAAVIVIAGIATKRVNILTIMASVIENNYEITSCKIDVSYSDGEIVSADIRVVTENDETNALGDV